jgi:hypothetical protein
MLGAAGCLSTFDGGCVPLGDFSGGLGFSIGCVVAGLGNRRWLVELTRRSSGAISIFTCLGGAPIDAR